MRPAKTYSELTKEDLIKEIETLLKENDEIKNFQSKKSRLKERENKQKYYSLFNHIADPVLIFDATSYHFLDCNEAVIKKYKYTKEEILSMTPFDLHKPEEFERLRANIDSRMSGATYTYTHLTKDRRHLRVEVSSAEIYYEGTPAWLWIAHEITERVNLEEELRRYRSRLEEMVDERTAEVKIANKKLEMEIHERKKAQLAIQKNEKKFRNIIEKSLDGILLVDEKGIIIEWNLGQENIYGTNRAMVIGKYIWDVQYQYEPKENKVKENYKLKKETWENFFETKVNPFQNDLQVSRIERPDGEQRDIQQLYFPIDTEKGVMMGCSTRDITRNLVLEKQLLQAQKMEAIGTLAGGIAHDFNNMLGAIMGYSDLAKRRLEESHPVQKYMDQVIIATKRASDLIKQILTFSRQDKRVKEVVHISSIVKEVLKLIRSSLPATIDIIAKIEPKKIVVMADPTQIHQVIMNLCTNAAHAMREKGGVLEVQLSEEDVEPGLYKGLKAGPCVRLTVSDTGHGIKPELRDKIFEPFFTTKKIGEGTGMGLAVVHGIIENLEGNISVYSELGKGTTFSILLPRVVESVIIKEKTENETPLGTERILLVEDDVPLAAAEKELLEGLGYKVTAMKCGVEALEIIKTVPDRFDIIITDFTMPRMTGVQLTQKIRACGAAIPVILCTGYSEVISEQEAKELGIGDIIQKPIDLDKIAKSIRLLIDKRS
ncbi:MAG: PAS domain S-box protein [Acidobacteria bacterium]|jgi:PAS domain S-box-containing protein|nr:PAS domain S-box protein [Acidobacteriota bacterium]